MINISVQPKNEKKYKNKKIQKALNFKRFIMKEPSKKEQAAEEVKIHRNI